MTIVSNRLIFKLKLFDIKLIQENKAGEIISILALSFKKWIIAGGYEV